MANETRPVVLFLHIPRTAGTTFNRALRLRVDSKRELLTSVYTNHRSWREFVAYVRSLPPRDFDRIRYYRGHFSYGIHTQLPKPATYVTMLRDPVDRVLSSYFFFIRQLGSDDVSIEDFVRKGREGDPRLHIGWTDNVQVRMLAAENGQPVKVPIGACTREMLELAKERIASDEFVLAGLTERFDESILLLRNKLGLRSCFYVTFNVGRMRPAPHNISQATRNLIESYNSLDCDLYTFAKERLEQQIKGAGSAFPRELERFRSVNHMYNKVVGPVARGFAKGYIRLSDVLQR